MTDGLPLRPQWVPHQYGERTETTMGETTPAGEGLSDEEMVEQVSGQTDSERQWEDFFEREKDGAVSDKAAADVDADEAQP